MTEIDMKALKAELLELEIRKARASAEYAELELAERQDVERDRLAKSTRDRILKIDDYIVPATAAKYIAFLEHWSRRDPAMPITVQINSGGGSVSDGNAVFDTIKRLQRQGHQVTTHGMGMVASMAAILLQAGDVRLLDTRAKLMIHEPSVHYGAGERLSAAEMDDQRAYTEMIKADMLEILAERSNLTVAEIAAKWDRRDWYLGAKEALELGFVDEVV